MDDVVRRLRRAAIFDPRWANFDGPWIFCTSLRTCKSPRSKGWEQQALFNRRLLCQCDLQQGQNEQRRFPQNVAFCSDDTAVELGPGGPRPLDQRKDLHGQPEGIDENQKGKAKSVSVKTFKSSFTFLDQQKTIEWADKHCQKCIEKKKIFRERCKFY